MAMSTIILGVVMMHIHLFKTVSASSQYYATDRSMSILAINKDLQFMPTGSEARALTTAKTKLVVY